MLRRMCGVTRLDTIRNERIRGATKVVEFIDKVKDDIKEKGLSADEVYDRDTWMRMSSNIDPA